MILLSVAKEDKGIISTINEKTTTTVSMIGVII